MSAANCPCNRREPVGRSKTMEARCCLKPVTWANIHWLRLWAVHASCLQHQAEASVVFRPRGHACHSCHKSSANLNKHQSRAAVPDQAASSVSPPGVDLGETQLSSTLLQLWVCPSRTDTNKSGNLILFLTEEMKMDSVHGNHLWWKQNWPKEHWLKRASNMERKWWEGGEEGEELERGNSCVNRRVRNEHQLNLPFLTDFNNKVPWSSPTSALTSLVLIWPYCFPGLKHICSIISPFLLCTLISFSLLQPVNEQRAYANERQKQLLWIKKETVGAEIESNFTLISASLSSLSCWPSCFSLHLKWQCYFLTFVP